MAEKERKLTWQQKLEKGVKLTPLEEVKADADFNFKRNERERQERAEFEATKARATREEAAAESDAKPKKEGK